jgi:hypothetical protein
MSISDDEKAHPAPAGARQETAGRIAYHRRYKTKNIIIAKFVLLAKATTAQSPVKVIFK